MNQPVGPTGPVTSVLASAFGAAAGGDGRVDTEHILAGLTIRHSGAAGRVLDEFDVTPVTATAALRNASGQWRSDDVADNGEDHPLDNLGLHRPVRYTSAARAALRRATVQAAAEGRTEPDPIDLLRALLADSNRAVELLDRCGVERDQLSRRLSGESTARRPDPVEPDLRRTRDILLGRAQYDPVSLPGRFAARFLRMASANYAQAPVGWVRLETDDQARRLGHRQPRTAHVLLAVLATYEVARAYPHMLGGSRRLYGGARALTELGVSYRAAREALIQVWDTVGPDPRRVAAYFRRRHDTTDVVHAILTGETSAVRVLTALGVPAERIRERARPE